jgi:hypothetical protein
MRLYLPSKTIPKAKSLVLFFGASRSSPAGTIQGQDVALSFAPDFFQQMRHYRGREN